MDVDRRVWRIGVGGVRDTRPARRDGSMKSRVDSCAATNRNYNQIKQRYE
jgi:hypothetical protein